jgi:hypothetical protein
MGLIHRHSVVFESSKVHVPTFPIVASHSAPAPIQYPPLDQVTRPHVPTDQAAYYLTRRPQTLRGWASSGSGPVRPHKVNGRLAWPVATIRALLEV